MNLSGHEHVLDFGSGAGPSASYIAIKLSKGDGELTCLDISPTWITVIKARLADYKNINFIQNIEKGGLLVTRHPAKPGQPGTNIYGKTDIFDVGKLTLRGLLCRSVHSICILVSHRLVYGVLLCESQYSGHEIIMVGDFG